MACHKTFCNRLGVMSDQQEYNEYGFTKCVGEPSKCDRCKQVGQLYFGDSDYWDRRDGTYLCESCLGELITAAKDFDKIDPDISIVEDVKYYRTQLSVVELGQLYVGFFVAGRAADEIVRIPNTDIPYHVRRVLEIGKIVHAKIQSNVRRGEIPKFDDWEIE